MEKTAFNQEKFRVENYNRPKEADGAVGTAERVASIAAGLLLLRKLYKTPGIHPTKLLTGSYLIYRGVSGKCLLYKGIGNKGRQSAVNARAVFTVNKPRSEVYAFWRKLSNLPKFMSHIESVEEKSETLSHWTMALPWHAGQLSWDASIVKDEPGELIGWHSEKTAMLTNSGKAEFFDAPGGRGTVVKLVVSYHPPAGELGRKVAEVFNPAFEALIKEDLRNFKQVIEAGEIATIKGQPSGRKK